MTSEPCRKGLSDLAWVMLVVRCHEKAGGIHGGNWAGQRGPTPKLFYDSQQVHPQELLKAFRKTLTTREVKREALAGHSFDSLVNLASKLLFLHVLTTAHLAAHVEGNKQFSLRYFSVFPPLLQKLVNRS